MKKQKIMLIILVGTIALNTFAQLPFWRDLDVFAVNKEYPRTAFMTFGSRTEALSKKFEESQYYMCLNGTWKFLYVDNEKALADDVKSESPNTTAWNDIKVPGNWEFQGFGTPIYLNHGYEFMPKNPKPPYLPKNTPVGVYHRSFDMPSAWSQRDVYLQLAGIKSGAYVYLNGQFVGYSEDSKNPADFNINRFVKPGVNKLTLIVYRWSTGSYLEAMDFWRVSGIERDVFVYAQPKTAVKDFRVVSTLDETFKNGVFELEVDVRNKDMDKKIEVKYELLDKNGKVIASEIGGVAIKNKEVKTLRFVKKLNGVNTWSSEQPYLYKLLMSVSENGVTTEVVPFNVGFRRLELKTFDNIHPSGKAQQLFLVNGQPIKFKGVNTHEHDPITGHYVSEELIRKDLTLMKQNNLNAVRLSHYPQGRRFYELADELGLYVYDEANIEAHGMYYSLRKGGGLGNNPDFLELILERTRNMFERNKNYPSVTFWSLGNEAGNGYNFYKSYLWLKQADKNIMNRPVNYERALWEWNTDIYVPQYPSAEYLDSLGKIGTDRPVIPSEYAHAMGNSTGNLWDQWQAIYKHVNLQGGFIWDWVDQGILAYDENGRKFFKYGGDYGVNQPSDGNFLCNGIVSPERIPHPAMQEVKYAHQNIDIQAVDVNKGLFKIKNRFYFNNLKQYELNYNIVENSRILHTGIINLALAPQKDTIIQIAIPKIKAKAGKEYFANFELKTLIAEPAIPARHSIAYEQIRLNFETVNIPFKSPKANFEILENKNEIVVMTKNLQFIFDKNQAVVSSYKLNNVEYFYNGFGIQPNFWRAPNDNDYGNGMPSRLQLWKNMSRNFKLENLSSFKLENSAQIIVDYNLSDLANYRVVYEIWGDGTLNVSVNYSPKVHTLIPDLPRLGVRFRIPANKNNIRYFGRGPGENYIDRNKGYTIAEYVTTAEEMYFPYVRPQENGHRTDVRWFVATDKNASGWLVKANTTLGFNALRNSVECFDSEEANHRDYQWQNFSQEEIENRNPEKAKNVLRRMQHINDVVFKDYVEICVDMKQQGVGGYDSWAAPTQPGFTIPGNESYSWAFSLVPVNKAADIEKRIALDYFKK